MNFAALLNNQPITVGLPFPLAGVLRPGEQITTRYSAARLRYLIDRAPGPVTAQNEVRELVVVQLGSGIVESGISPHSPPRDNFTGACETVGAVTSQIAWQVPGATAQAPVTVIDTVTNLAPGAYTALLTVSAMKIGSAGRGSYQRRLTFIVSAAGVVSLGNTQTIGTDVETDAGAQVSVTYNAGSVQVDCLGVAATTYRWAAQLEMTMRTGGESA